MLWEVIRLGIGPCSVTLRSVYVCVQIPSWTAKKQTDLRKIALSDMFRTEPARKFREEAVVSMGRTEHRNALHAQMRQWKRRCETFPQNPRFVLFAKFLVHDGSLRTTSPWTRTQLLSRRTSQYLPSLFTLELNKNMH